MLNRFGMIGWRGRRDAGEMAVQLLWGVCIKYGASPSEDGRLGLRVRATGSVAPATSLGRSAREMELRGVVARKEPCSYPHSPASATNSTLCPHEVETSIVTRSWPS